MCQAGEQRSCPVLEGTLQDGHLRNALIAADNYIGLAVPTSSTFEALPTSSGVEVPLASAAAKQAFTKHTAFRLPRQAVSVHDKLTFDVVHCFVLRAPLAMNDGLREWALHRELKAITARRDTLAQTNVESQARDLGVMAFNRGGYQSQMDIVASRYDASLDMCSKEMLGRRHVHEFHKIASEAVTACCEAPRHKMLHPGVAWVNVNRADDSNSLHIHQRGRLSVTYYVSGGEAPGPTSAQTNGCLVFRGGAIPSPDGRPPLTSHSYLSVPPTPGSLWLFPGSIPHVVMGMDQGPDQGTGMDDPPDEYMSDEPEDDIDDVEAHAETPDHATDHAPDHVPDHDHIDAACQDGACRASPGEAPISGRGNPQKQQQRLRQQQQQQQWQQRQQRQPTTGRENRKPRISIAMNFVDALDARCVK